MHTVAIPVVSEVADLFSAVDGAAMATLLAKLAVEKSYSAKLDEARSALQVALSPRFSFGPPSSISLNAR